MEKSNFTVNEMVDWTWEQVEEASAETLKGVEYGLTYFNFSKFGTPYTEERNDKLSRLYERLQEVKKAEAEAEASRTVTNLPKVKMVKASCGHMVADYALMSTSTGSSCPDCYDRMSL